MPVTEHYFSSEPSAPARIREVSFDLGGRHYSLSAAGGVFSADRLDTGTSVLLRKAPLPGQDDAGTFLDLGCGYGPIAKVLATVAPQAKVWAVDVNSRARELAAENTKGLNVFVSGPEGVPDDLRFDQIWSNPPIRVGKTELHGLLEKWLPCLEADGVAWLVVAKHKGADSLQAWLNEQGWAARRHASAAGFRVLKVVRA
jgi:16S rRNA G1207 methylase RsmC